MYTSIYYAVMAVAKANDEKGFINYDDQYKSANPELKALIIKSSEALITHSKNAMLHSSTVEELAVALAEAMQHVAYDIVRYNSKETCESLELFDSKSFKLSVSAYKTDEIVGHHVLKTLHFNNYTCTSLLQSIDLFILLEDSLSHIHPNTQDLFDCVVEASKVSYDLQDELMLKLITNKLNEKK